MGRPANLNPKRVWREDDECIRMNRAEFEAVRCLLGAINYVAIAKDDLGKRLDAVPFGKRRMAMTLGGLRASADDLIGSMKRGQCKQIRNTMDDMDMRMVPKMTPSNKSVILEKDIAKGLVDAAMEKCKGCVESAEDGQKCPLYKTLESFLPLDDYESGGLLCPYSRSEWRD